MAWYPAAVRKEVRRFRTPIRGPVRVNLHTAVTNTTSLFSHFNRPGNPCSHFYVRKDGTVEQYVDTRYRAAADLQGNPDTISIETWDGYRNGAPGYWRHSSDVPPWTDAQMRSMAALLAWLTKTHPSIPARLATSSAGSSSHGISWHRLGIDPWRVSGGLKYSNARGKVCPGDRRIAQIPTLVTSLTTGGVTIPTAPGGVPGGTLPDPLEPTMSVDNVRIGIHGLLKEAAEETTATGRQVRDYLRAVLVPATWAAQIGRGDNRRTMATALARAEANAATASAKVDAVLDAVKNIPGVDPDQLAKKVAAAVNRAEASLDGTYTVTVARDD